MTTDNGPPFNAHEFEKFAQAYKFEHVTSSLGYLQSNRKAENAVKLAKSTLRKAHHSGQDGYLSLVTSLCRSSYFHLRKIASIRPYLSNENTAQLVSSLILSRLDYCNSTLSGLPPCSLNRLQKVQNNAARLVLRKRKSDHVTPLLKKLHWLPAEARIHNKIATLAFRHFENSLPPYLSELLHTYRPSQTLRSSSEKLLKVPKTNLKSAGNRSFHFQAAKIWNSLPTNVRSSPSLSSFKKNLKIHLFKESFSLGL